MGGGGDQHSLAGVPAGLVGGADGQQAAELAVGAGLGRQGDGGHAGEGLQPVGQLVHQGQGALHGGNRLQRVDVDEAGQAGHLLIEARVVLHRARAQRIERQVDGVVLLAQAHIVAEGFGLREAGQRKGLGAGQAGQIRDVGVGFGALEVDPGLVPAAQFEDQRFVLHKASGFAAGSGGRVHGFGTGGAAHVEHGHWAISAFRAPARAAMSSSRVVSVAQTSRTSSRPALGSRRE